jgi:excinuclease ABC subunit C
MFSIAHLPDKPGCYLFRNKQGIILYIGKAKNLHKRVKSYQKINNLDPKTQQLMKQIHTIDFIVTDTEMEAFILENTLIKKHQPKYNIDLKDAKSYSYLRITDESYPRILIARRKTEKGSYFGPFVSAADRDYILQFLKKTFLLRTCKRMPKKPCLRYHIQLCDAPCIDNITEKEYLQQIETAKQILKGKIKEATTQIAQEMQEFSRKQQFEQALRKRNQLTALEHLKERQNMQRQKQYNEDIINYKIVDDNVYLMLFNVYKGTLSNKNDFVFSFHEDFLEEFITQYYSDHPIPKELIVPESLDESLKAFLSHQKKSKVLITVPQRGEKKQLLRLVKKNIDITFFANTKKIAALQQRLRLHEKPVVIECFDISHLSGTSMVGSMVQFRNGQPDKTNYRRFRIRTVEGIDDFKAIGEVVRRRYNRLLKEKQTFPDLIIIDGGKGQLNSALSILEDIGMTTPVISIAKRLEELYIPGRVQPLLLKKDDIALQYIQQIRDEAHRFAISYNRLLRSKEVISSKP